MYPNFFRQTCEYLLSLVPWWQSLPFLTEDSKIIHGHISNTPNCHLRQYVDGRDPRIGCYLAICSRLLSISQEQNCMLVRDIFDRWQMADVCYSFLSLA